MKFEDYMTLKEIEESFGVKADTIRNYINRDQVIPKEKIIKIGRQWFIDRNFATEKWGGQINNKQKERKNTMKKNSNI